MKTSKYNKGEFTTKDGKHEKFLVHVNEKSDGSFVVTSHVEGITVAAKVDYHWDDSSDIEYVIVDTLTGEGHHKKFDLPESDLTKDDIVAEVVVHVIGHALSTARWYEEEYRMEHICDTIYLHTDAVLAEHNIKLDLFRHYVNGK